MKGWLLDTNVVAALINPKGAPSVKSWAARQDEDTFHISVLPLAEYDKGIHNLPADHTERPRYIAARDALAERFGPHEAKAAGFVAVMLVVGRRLVPWILHHIAHTGSRELFRLAVLAIALGVAFGAAKLFGVSLALGAFFAGMIMSESELSHREAEESLPLRDAFSVLFFVSVGMLFDPSILIEEPLHVLAVIAVIVLGKTIAAFLLVLAFRYPLNTALTVSASLAQIGEFAFILASLGVALKLLPVEGQSLILAGALISIALNSFVFQAIEPLQRWIRARSGLARRLEQRDDPLAELPMSTDQKSLRNQVVLVGYGRVGRRIGDALTTNGIPYVVAEQNREIVEALRAYRARPHAGDRHARHFPRASDDRDRPHAEPGHRDRGADPQRGRSHAAGTRARRPYLPRRGRAGLRHDGPCARTHVRRHGHTR